MINFINTKTHSFPWDVDGTNYATHTFYTSFIYQEYHKNTISININIILPLWELGIIEFQPMINSIYASLNNI